MEMVQTSKMGPFVDTLKGGDNGNMVFRKVPFGPEIFSDCTDQSQSIISASSFWPILHKSTQLCIAKVTLKLVIQIQNRILPPNRGSNYVLFDVAAALNRGIHSKFRV